MCGPRAPARPSCVQPAPSAAASARPQADKAASRYTHTARPVGFPGNTEGVSLRQKGLLSVPGIGVPRCAGLRAHRTLSAPAPAGFCGHSLAGSDSPFTLRQGQRPAQDRGPAAGAKRRRDLWWPLASMQVCPSARQGETRRQTRPDLPFYQTTLGTRSHPL